jgi:uncharacterized protein DUF5672
VTPSTSVAIVVPVFRPLEDDDRTALRHLETHLGGYDRYVVRPRSLDVRLPDFAAVELDDTHFRRHRDYSRLMLGSDLYRRFAKYDYMLVHQLDCLVFGDELGDWCGRGYDYVGAPWVRTGPSGRPAFTGVGNGGFSLRRVASFLRVLDAARRPRRAVEARARHLRELGRRFVVGRGSRRQLLRDRYVYEDKFWSLEAPRLVPSFRIPPPEVAVSFAFEGHPRFCFEQNGGRLPFGCHKWRVHDPEFWAPFVLPDS